MNAAQRHRLWMLESKVRAAADLMGEVKLMSRALGQGLREAQTNLVYGSVYGRVGAGGGGETLLVRILGCNGYPVSGATVEFTIDYPGGSHLVNVVTNTQGWAHYILGLYLGLPEDEGRVSNITATGYSNASGTGDLVPFEPAYFFLSANGTTGICWSGCDHVILRSNLRVTDQYGTISIPFLNWESSFQTRNGFTTEYRLRVDQPDGSGGYKFQIRTTEVPGTLDIVTASSSSCSPKLSATFDFAGTATASRIYPTGSTIVTLDEI